MEQDPPAGPRPEAVDCLLYTSNEIRGVDSSGVFGSLLARKLISTAGRKPVVGRPILYKTTREFLLRFGLKDCLLYTSRCV